MIINENTTNLIKANAGKVSESTLLTVAIPAYKHSKFIFDCLKGVISCSMIDEIELIILDDASPDDTLDIALRLLSTTDIKYKIYRNTKNKGLTYGLNYLLSAAQGKFFLPCASDDRIDPHALSKILQDIKSNLNHISTFKIYGATFFGDREGPVYDTQHLERLCSNTQEFHHWLSTEIPLPLLLQSSIFNTEFLRKVNPWSDGLILDDWPTFLRSVKLACDLNLPVQCCQNINLTAYRVHSGGIHAIADRQKSALLEVLDKVIPVEHKPQASAFIYSSLSVSSLAQWRVIESLKFYVTAIKTYPSLRSFTYLPKTALFGVLRRIIGKS